MHEHCKFVVDGSLLNMLMLTAQDALCYTNLGLLGASPDLLEPSDPAAEACLNNLCFVMRSVCVCVCVTETRFTITWLNCNRL